MKVSPVRRGVDLGSGERRAAWTVMVAALCGCEFITGGLEDIALETDTDLPVATTVMDDTRPASSVGPTATADPGSDAGSATSGVTTSPPSESSADEGPGEAGTWSSSSGNEHDGGTTSGGTSGDGWSTGIAPETYGGGCCNAGDGAECEDPEITECVCAIDPYCCEQSWDDVCADLVEDAGCAMCKLGDDSSCCSPHPMAGCEAPEVSECVCATDPWCCEMKWDAVCVDEVEDFGCGPCDGVGVNVATEGTSGFETGFFTSGEIDPTGSATSGAMGSTGG